MVKYNLLTNYKLDIDFIISDIFNIFFIWDFNAQLVFVDDLFFNFISQAMWSMCP